MLLVVVSNRELHQLERIVKNIDPESFVIVSEVREVSGRGFSLTKEHKSTQSEACVQVLYHPYFFSIPYFLYIFPSIRVVYLKR